MQKYSKLIKSNIKMNNKELKTQLNDDSIMPIGIILYKAKEFSKTTIDKLLYQCYEIYKFVST